MVTVMITCGDNGAEGTHVSSRAEVILASLPTTRRKDSSTREDWAHVQGPGVGINAAEF